MDHQAFAQLLGNYGEIIGAITMVATLIFVGVEVRQSRLAMSENNELSKLASLDESRRGFSAWRSMLASDQEMSSLWRAGLAREELDDDQKFRFTLLLAEHQFLLLSAYDRYMQHDMSERANAMARGLAHLIEGNAFIPEYDWLPGTEGFRDELERQKRLIREKKGD
jgi:hypothetical protein